MECWAILQVHNSKKGHTLKIRTTLYLKLSQEKSLCSLRNIR